MDDAPYERPRWYRVTPGRAVLGMLAAEVFLFVSERFEWFAFNRHKGYTVLITVAAVAVMLLLTFSWFLLSLIFRWRFQFSIRSLFLLTVVVAAASGWLATARQQAEKQRVAVEEIAKLQGAICFDYQSDASGTWIPGATPPGPPWLRQVLGDDLLVSVTRVDFSISAEVSDARLRCVQGLTQLQWLGLNDKISDAGLQHLRGLTNLQELDLIGTKVSDAGLQHLKGLTRLQELYLCGTKVTDAGERDLKKALPSVTIHRGPMY